MGGVASPDLNLPHVLIVDDEDAICKMLSRTFPETDFAPPLQVPVKV